jgi:DNA-binding IclR family transcriptional regulator
MAWAASRRLASMRSAHRPAAIGISGPLKRLSVKLMKELTPAVQEAAPKISRAMSYRR